MRIGLYGGSFDPVHRGHVEPVLEACRALDLDRVIYLPTASPPHKPDRRMVSAHRRFTMVELAVLDHPELEVSAFEMDRHPAYTVDTLEHFLGTWSDHELFLMLGADSFLHIDSWRRCAELTRLAELVVLARPGWRLEDQTLPEPQSAALEAGRVHHVTNRLIAASSTEIRRCLQAGEAVPEDWLAPRVLSYLLKYRLYVTEEAERPLRSTPRAQE